MNITKLKNRLYASSPYSLNTSADNMWRDHVDEVLAVVDHEQVKEPIKEIRTGRTKSCPDPANLLAAREQAIAENPYIGVCVCTDHYQGFLIGVRMMYEKACLVLPPLTPETRRNQLKTLLRDKDLLAEALAEMSNTEVANVARKAHGAIYKRLFVSGT